MGRVQQGIAGQLAVSGAALLQRAAGLVRAKQIALLLCLHFECILCRAWWCTCSTCRHLAFDDVAGMSEAWNEYVLGYGLKVMVRCPFAQVQNLE